MTEQLPISLRVSLEPIEVTAVIGQFLKDYLSSASRKRFVVGLSGGLDSAAAAALAVRAVGAGHVHPIILPEDSTDPQDVADAELVARHLGLSASTISIQPFIEAFRTAIKDPTKEMLGNAKARFRMVTLHAEGARRQGLVLGTGNKSELLCGYFSKYGDGGVDLQPLGDLYKTQVRILAQHLGLPQRIIDKAPTAGLWAGQTDEGELGISYANLDRILLGLEIKLPQPVIAQIVGVPLEEVQRIEAKRATSQHKRRSPLSPKIGLRSVGLDWRMAVMEG